MNGYALTLNGCRLVACASGALWWPDERVLAVSDLHLGRSDRFARRGGALLPPYENAETLERLDADVSALAPATVICLGDSFDDLDAATLDESTGLWLARLMSGRRWVWIAGNHDPAPLPLAGDHVADLRLGGLVFRHVASTGAVSGEVSGHYHPKARVAGQTRRCFLADSTRIVLPAFGIYTGGLPSSSAELSALMRPDAIAVLTGRRAIPVPMPR
jgi:hypothetical protein